MCLLLCSVVALAGCQQKMGKQPAFRPLEKNTFYSDNRSARPLVAGTVARGKLETDVAYFTGRRERSGAAQPIPASEQASQQPPLRPVDPDNMADYVDAMPMPVTPELLKRGRERYTIYCAVCHGGHGYGDGVVVERGFTRPPSYHIERLHDAPVGYLFAVQTYGYGAMADYAEQVAPRDRWAIAAYIRALQLSQNLSLADLPADERERIQAKVENQSHERK